MSIITLTITVVSILLHVPNVEAAYSVSKHENLRTDYLDGYERFIRPVAKVNVSLSLSIITLNKLSISDQTMVLAGFLNMVWNDQRLDWSSDTKYNNDIPSMYSNEEYIWRPALIIENSVSDISVISDKRVLMRIDKSGDVTWTPSGIYTTHCETDVTYYPFDTQQCDVVVTTWTYSSIEIHLSFDKDHIRLTYFNENGEWSYESYSTSSTVDTRDGSSKPQLTFTLKFKRRPFFHILNSLVPMVLLAFLSAMVFKLPPDSGEKMGYSLTVLLAYAVYLTIVSANMPSSSTTTSVLSVYLLIVLALGVISVFITISILQYHHKAIERPVSDMMTKICLNFCAKVAGWKDSSRFCVRKVTPKYQEDHASNDKEDKSQGNNNGTLTLTDVCAILDAFFLRVYLGTVGLLTVIVLVIFIVGYYSK